MIEKKSKIENYIKKLIFKKHIPKNYLKINLFKFDNLDSLALFKMILKIESKYKIKVKDKDLFSEKFKSVKNIIKFIEKELKSKKKQ